MLQKDPAQPFATELRRVSAFDPLRWPNASPRPGSPEGRLLTRIASRAGQTIRTFDLIQPDDKILVCLSGGKDSFTMLHTLCHLKHRAPVPFDLAAVHVVQGYSRVDPNGPAAVQEKSLVAALTSHMEALGVEGFLLFSDIADVLLQMNAEGRSCYLCARFRRGVLYRWASSMGCSKIALGHHADDLIETLLLNLFFSGQIKSMPPKLVSDDGKNTVIRPLAQVPERLTSAYAEAARLPVAPAACRFCQGTLKSQRHEIKALLAELDKRHPKLKQHMLASLSNVRTSHLLDRNLLSGSITDPDVNP